MSTITILFVRRPWWYVVATLIRWALPVSRFKWARASHSIVMHGNDAYHATMIHGVVHATAEDALHGQVVVAQRDFEVPDLTAGIEWVKTQVGKPYDFKGAFGLSLSPDRIWGSQESWFCHELCAATLEAAGRKLFIDAGHVNDSSLLLVEPRYDTKKAA